MAKVTGPCLSYDCRGNLKKTIVYTFAKGRNIVKYYKKSTDLKTHAQQLQRGLYAKAVDAWNELNSEEKAEWNQFIGGDILTGYNAFLKNYLLYNDEDEYFSFLKMISKFYGIHIIIENGAFRTELLSNLIIEKKRGTA